MLTNRYLIALVVPIILILSGALAKKLVRGSSFTRTDFFLGVELALSALAAALTNFLDLSRSASSGVITITADGLARNASFLAISFFLLLVILATHQEWEKRANSKTQIFWLGLFANTVGGGLMVAFIVLVKGF